MIEIKQMMIFAAGRGHRLRPITDHLPKPLLEVGGRPLIEYHLEKAALAGIQMVVINVSYLGQTIIDQIGDGARWGLQIHYSIEPHPLETAGGLVYARHLFQDGPFLLANADIYIDLDFVDFMNQPRKGLHLLLVPNPLEQPAGNFLMSEDGVVMPMGYHQLAQGSYSSVTYGGVAILTTAFIESIDMLGSGDPEHERIPFYMKRWMLEGRVSGYFYDGLWCDIGTPQRLAKLRQRLLDIY